MNCTHQAISVLRREQSSSDNTLSQFVLRCSDCGHRFTGYLVDIDAAWKPATPEVQPPVRNTIQIHEREL